jgi:hypothetical protein
VGEQHEHGGKKAEGDVSSDVGAAQSEHRRADEAEQTDRDRREQRLSQTAIIDDLPSPFVAAWLPRASNALERTAAGDRPVPRTGIDLAMGHGRHARLLAQAGFRTFGIDVKFDAVRNAVARARGAGLTLHGWCGDLRDTPLPRGRFDVVVVTRYLQRDLFPAIRLLARPGVRGAEGGFVLYETFTVNQRRLGRGPASADHLLEPRELLHYFDGFEIVFYEEVDVPEAVARLVARRRS